MYLASQKVEDAFEEFGEEVRGYLDWEVNTAFDDSPVEIPEPLLLLRKLRLYVKGDGQIPFLSSGAYEDQPYVYSRAIELCVIREIEFEREQARHQSEASAAEAASVNRQYQEEPSLRGIAVNPADRIRAAYEATGQQAD